MLSPLVDRGVQSHHSHRELVKSGSRLGTIVCAAWHAGVAAGWLLGKSATHLGAGARRGAALSSGARAACHLRAHRGAHDARDLREAVARQLGGRVGAPQLLLHLLAAREAWVG